jgi:hypothetical protein
MAQFNLNDYETVEERLKRFWRDHPTGSIVTTNQTTADDRSRGQWVVYAEIYFDRADGRPAGSGLAFEIDGAGMANKTSALENCETSAIGRALANSGYSGDKRASREEMAKVQRMSAGLASSAPMPSIDPATANSIDELQALWAKALDAGLTDQLQPAFSKRKAELS